MSSSLEVNVEGESMPIQNFKLEWMCPNPSICMIAKRGSGKSWVCRDLLRQTKDIPGGLIIAPTDKMSCFYGKFVPDLYIHYEYQPEVIDKLLYRQDMMIKKMKEKAEQGKKVDPRSFLLMDDCLSSKGKWMKDQQISTLFFDGRHYKIMFVLTMQFPLGITPEFRSNFDYIFLLADDFISNKKRLHEHYAGMFKKFQVFEDVFSQITDDFGCMVIANRGARRSLLEKVFWYKASNIEIKDFGCKQYQKIHEWNYDVNWRDRENSFADIEAMMTKSIKNKTRFKISKVSGIEHE